MNNSTAEAVSTHGKQINGMNVHTASRCVVQFIPGRQTFGVYTDVTTRKCNCTREREISDLNIKDADNS